MIRLVTILFLLIPAHFVLAQTPARAIKVADGFADFETNAISAITDLYFSGDWSRLQDRTMDLLHQFQFKSLTGADPIKLDFKQHYYSVVFVYTGPDRKEEVLRFLVHDPPTEPYTLRMPGLRAGSDRQFYEVFLSERPDETLVSTYLSVREPGELESQIPKFLKQFDPKVLSGLVQALAPQHRIYAVLSRVDLPYSRATIQIEDVIQRTKGEVTENFRMFNRPHTRLSFGLVSSLIVSSSESDTRATIDSGDLTQDPLRGHMPMGVLNIHPWSYDADSEEIGWRERVRFFVGGILAPEFGFSTGLSFQIVRGFSINAGVGVLLIDTLKDGEQIGREPVDPEDPFEYGTAAVLFFGVGYNF